MKNHRTLLLAAAITCLAPLVHAGNQQEAAAIWNQREVLAKAILAQDFDGIANLYCKDADLIGFAGSLVEGRSSIRDYLAERMEESGGIKGVEFQRVAIRFLQPDLALEDCTVSYTRGKSGRAHHTRSTVLWKKSEGQWRALSVRLAPPGEGPPKSVEAAK